jgi:hypothetical protein
MNRNDGISLSVQEETHGQFRACRSKRGAVPNPTKRKKVVRSFAFVSEIQGEVWSDQIAGSAILHLVQHC